MAAGAYNLSLEQGASFQKVITWRDDQGNPVDLTGQPVRAQVRERPGGQVVLDLNTDNGGITVEPLAGRMTLTATPEETALIQIVKGVWDLVIGDGVQATRLLEGRVRVSRAVTLA